MVGGMDYHIVRDGCTLVSGLHDGRNAAATQARPQGLTSLGLGLSSGWKPFWVSDEVGAGSRAQKPTRSTSLQANEGLLCKERTLTPARMVRRGGWPLLHLNWLVATVTQVNGSAMGGSSRGSCRGSMAGKYGGYPSS